MYVKILEDDQATAEMCFFARVPFNRSYSRNSELLFDYASPHRQEHLHHSPIYRCCDFGKQLCRINLDAL